MTEEFITKNKEPLKEITLTLRPVNIQDEDILFFWRCDKETKIYLNIQGEIKKEAHLKWLTTILEDDDSHMYIAQNEGVPVGMFELRQDDKGIHISWLIAPSERSKGIGKKMVGMFMEKLEGPLHVKIWKLNSAAIKIAENYGFVANEENNDMITFSK